MTHIFHDAARKEFLKDARWYGERSPEAAENFIAELRAAVELICSDPERFQPIGGGARVFRLKQYPHHVIYLVVNQTVFIAVVGHTKRRPGYWRDRLK
jgi:plasmid stabilization system protein ParE